MLVQYMLVQLSNSLGLKPRCACQKAASNNLPSRMTVQQNELQDPELRLWGTALISPLFLSDLGCSELLSKSKQSTSTSKSYFYMFDYMTCG
jgi:hypothetical protein